MSREGLTTKEKLFVEYYLGESFYNATDAARRAGYKWPNKQGPRLLVKVGIKAAIDARVSEAAMTANEVLARLSKMARGSLADVLNDEEELDLKDAKKRRVDDLLKKIKKRVGKEGDVSHEYEIHDAQAALVHLGKYHKLFNDRTEVSGPNGGPIVKRVIYEVISGGGSADNQNPDEPRL